MIFGDYDISTRHMNPIGNKIPSFNESMRGFHVIHRKYRKYFPFLYPAVDSKTAQSQFPFLRNFFLRIIRAEWTDNIQHLLQILLWSDPQPPISTLRRIIRHRGLFDQFIFEWKRTSLFSVIKFISPYEKWSKVGRRLYKHGVQTRDNRFWLLKRDFRKWGSQSLIRLRPN